MKDKSIYYRILESREQGDSGLTIFSVSLISQLLN